MGRRWWVRRSVGVLIIIYQKTFDGGGTCITCMYWFEASKTWHVIVRTDKHIIPYRDVLDINIIFLTGGEALLCGCHSDLRRAV